MHAGADPQSHLRWLTSEALRAAVSGRQLARVSIGLQAVTNAFVALGLLPEARAETILAEHESALEASGLGTSSLRVIVSTFWEAAWADIGLPAPARAGQGGAAGDG